MNQDGKHMGQAHGTRLVEVSLLCLGGLLINILGVRLALGLKLPLFLDNIGSVLTAALGGYIPGIIVGFLTNLINGISDYTTAYYGSLTVMIAICAALFAKNGWFRSPSKIIAVIVTFALIGGGLGSVLTWMLYGFSFGEGISSPLAHRIYDTGLLSMFWSQFSADMLIDVADKTITVLIVALVVNPLIVGITLRHNPYPLIFKCIRQSGVTAFFTRSSAANIPVNMELCKELGLDEDMYSVSIPLGSTINMDGAAAVITTFALTAANSTGAKVSLPMAILLSVVSTFSACGTSGVAGGSLLLVPLACSLFGISNDVAMQIVGVGFIVSVIQDSLETALNSSGDVIFTATAEFMEWKKEGKELPI